MRESAWQESTSEEFRAVLRVVEPYAHSADAQQPC